MTHDDMVEHNIAFRCTLTENGYWKGLFPYSFPSYVKVEFESCIGIPFDEKAFTCCTFFRGPWHCSMIWDGKHRLFLVSYRGSVAVFWEVYKDLNAILRYFNGWWEIYQRENKG